MRRYFSDRIMMFFICIFLGGCASVLSPYNSEFDCPNKEKGKCISALKAHQEVSDKNASAQSKEQPDNTKKTDKDKKTKKEPNIYQESLLKKIGALIDDPHAPMIMPASARRILILRYTDGDDFYGSRYLYYIKDKSRWVLEDQPFID